MSDTFAELRQAILDETAGPEDGSQFESGARAAYNFILSEWPDAAQPTQPPQPLDVERLARVLTDWALSDSGYSAQWHTRIKKRAAEAAKDIAAAYNRAEVRE